MKFGISTLEPEFVSGGLFGGNGRMAMPDRVLSGSWQPNLEVKTMFHARRVFPVFFFALILFGALVPRTFSEPQDQTVTVGIDFGARRYYETKTVSWKEGMTVLNALQSAIRLETRPMGDDIYVTSIDGVAERKDEKGWLFDVNGKMGDTFANKTPLNPGDYVRWNYSDPSR